jgi:hypothetical protein
MVGTGVLFVSENRFQKTKNFGASFLLELFLIPSRKMLPPTKRKSIDTTTAC